MRLGKHLLFWILITAFLTTTFGQSDGDYVKSFLFVTFLLPAAMATSYFFNYYLVPRYLLAGRYFSFGLYFLYTLIVSLYLEMVALVLAFVLLANYKYANLNPYSTNLFLLTTALYLIVFVNAFVLLVKQYQNNEHVIHRLHEEKARNEQAKIIVRSDRKNCPVYLQDIYYLESLADYVKIHTAEGQVITKEKISAFDQTLPGSFVRVHRSFIVNSSHVQAFTQENVQVNNLEIPLGRTYKKNALSRLTSTQSAAV